MRSIVAAALVSALCTSAHAQTFVHYSEDEIALTRRVIGGEASKARTMRYVGGIGSLVIGASALPLGIYAHSKIKPGGFLDLSDIEYGFAYTLMGLGALGLVVGTLTLAIETPQEQLHERLEASVAIGHANDGVIAARRDLTMWNERVQRRKGILRIVGLTLVGMGTTSILLVAIGPTELDSGAGLGLGIGGGAAIIMGGSMALGTLFETPIEKMERELPPPSRLRSAGVIPMRGGALLGLSGSF